MKKVYISGHWIFATKDLAIVCGNILNPIEVEVPEEAKVITGTIYVDAWGSDGFIINADLDGGIDPTDLCDYEPIIDVNTQTGYDEDNDGNEYPFNYLESFETKGLNYKVEHLSKDLQTKIHQEIEKHI